MTSTLAQQLAAIANAVGNFPRPIQKGKASLLYSPQEAADVDVQTIYTVAVQGFEELCRQDERLAPYGSQLLGRKALTLDRQAMTRTANEALDVQLRALLGLLTDRLLQPAAFQVLELLLRVYRVHERNVDDLLSSALPYHGSNEFVRLVQVCALPPNGLWSWLAPIQKSGAALPRAVLVQRCVSDRAVLERVCRAAGACRTPRALSRVQLSFYAVLVCEVLASMRKVDEALASMLLPHLLSGFARDSTPDYRCASLMVAAQLAGHATLGPDLLTALLVEASKAAAADAAQLPQALMLLAHLCAAQSQLRSLPPRAFKHLARAEGLPGALAGLAARRLRVARLVRCVLQQAVAHAQQHGNYAALLLQLVEEVPLDDCAEEFASSLLHAAVSDDEGAGNEGSDGPDGGHQPALRAALRALDARYPLQVDAAVNAELAKAQGRDTPEPATPGRNDQTEGVGRPGGVDNGGGSGGGGSKAQQERERRLMALLQGAFGGGSARQPAAGGHVTLLLGVDAPAAGVRCAALRQLDEAVRAGAAGEQAEAFLREALLRRLQDDDLSVVSTALGLESVADLSADELLPVLGPLLGTLRSRSERSKARAERAAARAAARRALRLLGPLAARSAQEPSGSCPGGCPEALCAVLLDSLLATGPRGRMMGDAVLAAARRIDHPLLQGLRQVKMPPTGGAAAQPPEALNPSKQAKKCRGKKAEAAEAEEEEGAAAAGAPQQACGYEEYDKAALAGLASGLAAASEADLARLAPLLELCGPRGRVALLCAAQQCAEQGPAAPTALVGALLSFWRQRQQALAAALPPATGGGGSNNKQQQPLQLLDKEPKAAQAAAAHAALRNALGALASSKLGDGDVQRLVAAFEELSSAEPRAVMQPLLEPLAAAAATAAGGRASFLSRIAGQPLPSGDQAGQRAAAAESRAAALRMMGAGYGKSRVEDVAEDLPALLLALSSPARVVREAAVQAAQALQQAAASFGTSDAALPASSLHQLLAGVSHHARAIAADGDALPLLLSRGLAGGGAATPLPAKAGRRGGKRAAAAAVPPPAGSQQPTTNGALELDATVRESLRGWVLAALPRQHPGGDRHAVAGLLLRFVLPPAEGPGGVPPCDPGAILKAACELLVRLLDDHTPTAASAAAEENQQQQQSTSFDAAGLEAGLAAQLLGAFSPAAVEALSHSHKCFAGALATLERVITWPERGAAPLPAAVRIAALGQVGPELYSHLTEDERAALLASLMHVQSASADEGVARATRAALAALPITAPTLLPLLATGAAAVAPSATPSRKKARKSLGGAASAIAAVPAAASAAAATAAGFDARAAALELLQWKEGVGVEEQLIAPLQSLAASLLEGLSSPADQQQQQDGGSSVGDVSVPRMAPEARAAHATYCLALSLSALARIAGREPSKAALRRFKVADAVAAARAAPDVAVRTAALQLLGALAEQLPEQTLQHVLEVVGLVSESASLQEDSHSQRLLATTLAAVVPPWLNAGRPASSLVLALAERLPGMPPHARLPLMALLVGVLPEGEGLPLAVAELLRRAADTPGPGAEGEGAGGAAESDWLLELVGSLAAREHPSVRCDSLAPVVESCLESCGGLPQRPLAALGTAYATQQLRAAGRAARRAARGDTAASAHLQGTLEALLRLVLSQLQALGRVQGGSGAAAAAAEGCYRCLAALEAGMAAPGYLRALVELAQHEADQVRGRALRLFAAKARELAAAAAKQGGDGAEEAAHHQQEEGEAAGSGSDADDASGSDDDEDAVDGRQRMALEWEGLEEDGGQGAAQREAAAAERAARDPAAVAAALAMCGPAASAAAAGSGAAPLTQQHALVALGMLAQWLGSRHPQRFLELVPSLLGLLAAGGGAGGSVPRPVRASALACLASIARSLGVQLIPVLPQLVPEVISCAERALQDVAAAAAKAAAQATARPGPADGSGSDSSEEEEDDQSSSSEEDESSDGDDEGGARKRRREAAAAVEAAAARFGGLDEEDEMPGGRNTPAGQRQQEEELQLELASGLACVLALVRSRAGPFLSPYLPALLRLLLSARVLRCHVAGVSRVAEQVRAALPAKLPVRLLLPPLIGHLEAAVQEGDEAVAAHLQLLSSTVSSMDRAAAAAHHEAVLRCLLHALDLRRRRPASLLDIPRAEAAAADALVALTMKLSETRFKPAFLRMLEWASTAHPDDPGALARSAALYRCVGSLTERLRSIFVPYFRYLLDGVPSLLAASAGDDDADEIAAAAAAGDDTTAIAPKKKRRKASGTAAAEEGVQGSGGAFREAHAWALKAAVLRALHRCCLYDASGFISDEGRFARLLPHVVAQLAESPPPSLLAASADGASIPGDPGADLDAELTLGALSDATAAAVTAAAAAPALEATALGGGGPGGGGGHGLLDGYAKAVVGCLAAMAVAAGSDALWKPLNHQVLMQTRAASPRTRLAALEAVAQLVGRLREEYLVLLPEALPFLAELLEDSEVAVEDRAKALLRQLEALSGESLEQYLQT